MNTWGISGPQFLRPGPVRVRPGPGRGDLGRAGPQGRLGLADGLAFADSLAAPPRRLVVLVRLPGLGDRWFCLLLSRPGA